MIRNSHQIKSSAPFLRYYFAIQSYLQSFKGSISLPFYKRRQRLVWRIYALTCLTALSAQLLELQAPKTFALGLVFPGGGFVYGLDGLTLAEPLLFLIVSILVFGLSIIVWFATGNVVLPVLALLATAIGAVLVVPASPSPAISLFTVAMALLPPVIATFGLRSKQPLKTAKQPVMKLPVKAEPARNDEIELEDLRRLQLLLDRALQPADQFNGFEWRDQFQTAAVRYQINFLSYALSIAQRTYCPAATAYFETAQRRLLEKQGDHRIWRYWALENAWGNLRLGCDPVPKDNIMYSGFVALQMALSGTNAPLSLNRNGEVGVGQYQVP